MKKEELKRMLKPIVQECIKECIEENIHAALFDSGIVASVVAEVIKGVNIPRLVESIVPTHSNRSVPQPVELVESSLPQMSTIVNGGSAAQEALRIQRAELEETKRATRRSFEASLEKKLGVNVFENVAPIITESQSKSQSNENSPLGGVSPNDPGVNLAKIPGLKTLDFKRHIKE